MSRLKKDEFYTVAVNQGAGTYFARKWSFTEIEEKGIRWAAVYPFCMVHDYFKSLADVRKFCKELDKEGYTGRIYTD